MTASRRLSVLADEIAACRICREAVRPLPHEPRPVTWFSPTARLCVSGQAPGTRVHATGIPFNDRSGDRLRDWLGIDRETFYDRRLVAVVPMAFCFPGQDARGADLPPRPECRSAWHDRVFAAMPQLELVLAIGQYAQAYHLGPLRRGSLTRTVSDWREIWQRTAKPRVLPLPHPSWRNTAWLKRNPWFEAEVVPVLRDEVRRLIAGVDRREKESNVGRHRRIHEN